MKKKEPSITKNSRFSISQANKITEYVEKYSYENDSELIRIAVLLLMKYHDYEDKFEDYDERMKFAEEIDPLIKTEKKQKCLETILINSSDEELERFYFITSQERNDRAKNKIKNAKDERVILQAGGEFESKVGYVLSSMNGIKFYGPITPNHNEWNDLSKEDMNTLLLDLQKKRMDLETLLAKSENSSDDHRFSRIDRIIHDVEKGISDEE
ncbi:MAG: hypothetical protein ACW9W9_00515 [Candidatus Nitrosopumilus sp. Bin_571-38]